MKKLGLFLALALLVATSAHAGPVSSLDDITFWVGSGSNRAAIAIDWDGASGSDTSYVWGYRWDGAATGEDMLLAVVAADARLFAKIGYWGGGLGAALYGLGYDQNADGQFAIDDGTFFNADGFAVVASASDGASTIDPGDLYREGWMLGFWHYGVATGNPYDGGSWSSSNWGMSNRDLADGDWDSWAFDAGFTFTAYAQNPQAAAVPEPGTLLLAGLGALALAATRYRRAKQALCGALLLALTTLAVSQADASSFATQVIRYTPGDPVGVANPAPFQTDGSQALGSPSHDTLFGSQVGVFYPAFGGNELVIIGAGGELIVGFDRPVLNHPGNPYGIDLLVFGNAFYVRNPQTGRASGIFAEPGNISLSQDGLVWYDVPNVYADTAFPTLGYTDTVYSGFGNNGGTTLTDFTKPVDPSFNPIGLTEAEINAGYNGSGGGTGIDLAWVGLDWIQYVRVWQPAGQGWSTEIDGFAIVSPVPEPGTLLLAGLGLLGLLAVRRRK